MSEELFLDRYRLLSKLGEGSTGVVWRAWDELLQRELALKQVQIPPGPHHAEVAERVLREARAAARVTHPAMVAIHDVLFSTDQVVIAMELLPGPTLADRIRREGPMAPEAARSVMTRVAGALAAAHDAGVVHRDVKPGNIFWLDDDRVVVCDFGLARMGAGTDTVTGPVGTPGYMAPEQIRGEVAGPPADVFGWGAVTYELLAGRAPFGDPATTDVTAGIYRILHEEPPPLPRGPDPQLAGVVEWAMAKEPADRPADGRALLSALASEGALVPARAASPAPVRAPAPAAVGPPPPPPTGRPRHTLAKGLAAFVLVLALAGLAALVVGIYQNGEGFGTPVRLEPFGTAAATGGPSAPGPSPTTTTPPGLVFYRVVGPSTSCTNVLAEPRTGARVVGCAGRGSLLAGTDERRENDGRKWSAVREPLTDTLGWIPAESVERA